jgi:hypothetical protein
MPAATCPSSCAMNHFTASSEDFFSQLPAAQWIRTLPIGDRERHRARMGVLEGSRESCPPEGRYKANLKSGDVATRSSDARGEPSGHEVPGVGSDDRNRARHALHSARRRAIGNHEHISAQADQFPGDLRDPRLVHAERAVLGNDVLTVHPAQLPHPVPEGALAQRHGQLWRDPADPMDFSRLLPLGGKRRGKDTSQRGQQEAAAVHGGMVEQALVRSQRRGVEATPVRASGARPRPSRRS